MRKDIQVKEERISSKEIYRISKAHGLLGSQYPKERFEEKDSKAG